MARTGHTWGQQRSRLILTPEQREQLESMGGVMGGMMGEGTMSQAGAGHGGMMGHTGMMVHGGMGHAGGGTGQAYATGPKMECPMMQGAGGEVGGPHH